jgi:hypothetical protein
MELRFPIKGYSKRQGAELQPEGTTPYIQNMRILDVEDQRVRGGQRPGYQKAYSQQLANASMPIVDMVVVTTID